MATDLDRTRVTFAQAEGAEPLPAQLQPGVLSPKLRAGLWHILYDFVSAFVGRDEVFGRNQWVKEPLLTILRDMHVWKFHRPADEFTTSPKVHVEQLKTIVMLGTYVQVLDLIQWMLRHPSCGPGLAKGVSGVLSVCGAGYRLTPDGKTFLPIASEEEAKAATQAFLALNDNQYAGARTHLVRAAENLTAGDNPGAVREGMQAVESVARVITGKNSFADAVKVIDKRWKIHGALKVAFGSLYGYSSDEKGIRHPLLDDPKAQVDESEALFMFSACAAVITYLVGKATANPAPA
jgi:hypothetical protein